MVVLFGVKKTTGIPGFCALLGIAGPGQICYHTHFREPKLRGARPASSHKFMRVHVILQIVEDDSVWPCCGL
jgi:hypothetical protein